MTQLYNHLIPSVSKLEKRMISHISPGGNWKDIPKTIPSQRLKQIRKKWWQNYLLWQIKMGCTKLYHIDIF